MGCCSTSVEIGCFSFCDEIALGYNATETGAHTLEVYVVNGTVKELSETYSSGSEMTITANTLSEAKTHDIKIKMPSGDYYEFSDGVTCCKVTTRVHL